METPMKAIRAANSCLRANGTFRNSEVAKAVASGAMKPKRTPSAKERYLRESVIVRELILGN
jgi:hypothetical protein